MTHPLQKFRYCPVCGSDCFEEQNDRSKRCRQCGFHYYLNAVAAVAGFIVSENGGLLLCRRAQEPHKGTFDLTGGFVDIAETAENAMKREIREELNLEVEMMKFLFSVPNEYLYSDFVVRTLDLFFLVKIKDFSTLKCSDDVSDAVFVPFKDIKIEEIGLKSIKIAVEKFLKTYDNINLSVSGI
ncbi:MAG: NUDIX domain-containing protein [Prevotellaceae bacterium]|jgi:ADP-ribose pyrophosphatase YjhB (NUDIX family)|nr:NUDIX domain-containing protein [Prevotellaceae bacterium]